MMFQTMADCGVMLEKYIEEDVAEKQVVEIKEILGKEFKHVSLISTITNNEGN